MAKVLVTGGCGFIGSAVCRALVQRSGVCVVNVDKLTYAAAGLFCIGLIPGPRYRFYRQDICDSQAMASIITREQPDAILHLAAETHVDRSISGPSAFISTNIVGTYTLLDAARNYWLALKGERAERFRFLHISTDEVFGSLGTDGAFTESTPYDPSSPYAASKAASDHLVRAWVRTYGFPAIITNCSNNYGPYQFPEKLIPLMITNALMEQDLPVYGTGENVRDWLYVEDHADALITIMERGAAGESYNVGGRGERANLEVVRAICRHLDRLQPRRDGRAHEEAIRFVADRPGHDLRYAIDATKLERALGWRARETFESGLTKTIEWYIENEAWWRPLRESTYRGERLGLLAESA